MSLCEPVRFYGTSVCIPVSVLSPALKGRKMESADVGELLFFGEMGLATLQ